MATDDRCVTIHPYFQVEEGELDSVRPHLERLLELTRSEPSCLYFGFSFCGNRMHCREGFTDGAAALAHLDNIGSVLQEMLESGKVKLTELQIHGPEEELATMRDPLAPLNPTFWVLEYGFRKAAS